VQEAKQTLLAEADPMRTVQPSEVWKAIGEAEPARPEPVAMGALDEAEMAMGHVTGCAMSATAAEVEKMLGIAQGLMASLNSILKSRGKDTR
jgi:hypothetical protein